MNILSINIGIQLISLLKVMAVILILMLKRQICIVHKQYQTNGS